MLFVKIVFLFDIVMVFWTILYKMYIGGMTTSERLKWSFSKESKTYKTYKYLMLLAMALTFVATMTFVILLLF